MRHKQAGFSLAIVALLVVVAAATSLISWRVYVASSTPTSSVEVGATLTGIISEGPTAPVCRTDVSCERPVSNHTVEALDSSGGIVAQGSTDDNGRYTLQLQPGHYTLVLVPKVGLGNIPDNQVDVKAGVNTHNLSVDTGLR
jgi:hypothetical protein